METLHEGRGNGVTEWRPSLGPPDSTGLDSTRVHGGILMKPEQKLRTADEKSILELLLRILELTMEILKL